MKIRQYRDQFIKTYRQFMEGEAGFSTWYWNKSSSWKRIDLALRPDGFTEIEIFSLNTLVEQLVNRSNTY
jgi:hypothetical protein